MNLATSIQLHPQIRLLDIAKGVIVLGAHVVADTGAGFARVEVLLDRVVLSADEEGVPRGEAVGEPLELLDRVAFEEMGSAGCPST